MFLVSVFSSSYLFSFSRFYFRQMKKTISPIAKRKKTKTSISVITSDMIVPIPTTSTTVSSTSAIAKKKKHECFECCRTFSSKKTLGVHNRTYHRENERRIHCSMCDYYHTFTCGSTF